MTSNVQHNGENAIDTTGIRPHPHVLTLDQRVDLIKQQGIEVVVCLEFTPELASISAEEFANLLAGSLNMKGLVMGPDSAIGKDRQGDLAFMKQQGGKLGFWAQSVETFEIDGESMSVGLGGFLGAFWEDVGIDLRALGCSTSTHNARLTIPGIYSQQRKY